MEKPDFLLHAKLKADVLEAWIEAGWLKPVRRGGLRRFSEIDLARAQFIQDLKHRLGVNDEGIPTILDLVDQLHGVRRLLHGLLFALSMQPGAQRQRIVREVRAVVMKGAPGMAADAKRSGARAASSGSGKSTRARQRRRA